MKVILFNGPPSSGKDTAARHLFDGPLCSRMILGFTRFSMPIKAAFAGAFTAPISDYGEVLGYEELKDAKLDILNGKSYREWQIDFSEKFMKPLYGENIFGRLMTQRLIKMAREGTQLVVIPDCGFQIEVIEMCILIPTKDILFVQVHRPGCDFSSDFRSYFDAPTYVLQTRIQNDGTKEQFEGKVDEMVGEFLQRSPL